MTCALQNQTIEPEFEVVSPDEMKSAMRCLASGVSVITAGVGEARTGATVTSATVLSVEPATIVVSINRGASVWSAIHQHKHFCMNILTSKQQIIADRFAGRSGEKGIARYADAQWSEMKSGALALSDALVSIDCEVEAIFDKYTHSIIIGRALKVITRSGDPLIYYNGGYQIL